VSPRTFFRSFAVAEVVTWALLIGGMLLKYVAKVGDWPVSVAGPIHGFVFLAYLVAGVVVAVNQRWSVGVTALALASAVVPFASLPVERWIDRRGGLAGDWRRTATDDPRDRRPLDRLLRWVLGHLALAVVLLVAAVVVVFVLLLIVGPPVGG
jgi:integral membrane protein